MEKQSIRQLLQSPQFQSVEALANELCIKIKENSPVRETADLTLQEVCLQEGKIQGIRLFIQQLYDAAMADKK